jgi:TPR repeat protein
VKDEAELVGYFKFAADQNHAATQFHDALFLEDGLGIVKDEAEAGAAGYYNLAADQNHTSTQFHYALCLEDDRGLAKNEAKLLDTSNLLPIRMMHHPKTAVPFALRPGEAL